MSEVGALGPPTTVQDVQLLTLRQIGENIASQTRRLESLSAKMDDVRERLVRLETQEAGKLVDTVRRELQGALSRIDELEAQRDRVVGVTAFWSWLARIGPWLAAGLGAFLAGVSVKGGGR
ncbi:hypothetical protein GALL_443050 [mine drainage metagenome]|uniref:Uncharacterized protein n=1 Tax=mine drainage metagenome TaxID=410659 RepID=A0A1J5PR33_9ZZZZ